MHDTISFDSSEGSKEWTFRRIGNLTCWAAWVQAFHQLAEHPADNSRALRHRYNLPINLPTTVTASTLVPKPSSLPSRTPGPSPLLGNPTAPSRSDIAPVAKLKDAQRIDFDPALVAKKGEGWEAMFETVLYRWLEEAAAEATVSLTPVA